MCQGYRFPKVWEIEGKLKSENYQNIYTSSESNLLCPKDNEGDCLVSTETFYQVSLEKRRLVDSIQIKNVGLDTWNTYCLTLGAIEFYGDHPITSNHRFSLSLTRFIIFLLI